MTNWLKKPIKQIGTALLALGLITPLGSYTDNPNNSDMSSAMQDQAAIVIGTAALFAVTAIVIANIHKDDPHHHVVVVNRYQ